MGYRAVRTDRYKYIRYLKLPGMDELYDLEVDPYELDNLMGSPSEHILLPYMTAWMARLQWETNDKLGQ
jgi:arylsulfatase A-like enzyme